jgi:nitrite reductase/ring-hydroxylating ferredoxin subunit
MLDVLNRYHVRKTGLKNGTSAKLARRDKPCQFALLPSVPHNIRRRAEKVSFSRPDSYDGTRTRYKQNAMSKLISVATLAQIKKKKPVCLEHRGVPYCVVRVKKDTFKAFITICTHKDLAMFPADLKKGDFVCPYHDAAFDLTTGKPRKSNRKKADRLPEVDVEINKGMVQIETRKKHRSLVPKDERKWVEKTARKMRKQKKKG